MQRDTDEEGRGPVGVLEIFTDPTDGQITFHVHGEAAGALPMPINGDYYTQEELKAMPVPYALVIIALHLVNQHIQERAAVNRLAAFGQPDGGTVH